MLGSELHFHRPLIPSGIKAANCSITYNFSSLHSLNDLQIALIQSKLEYKTAAWNSLTFADSNKLEDVERKFTNLRYK
jgi:hypothetical protein